MRTILVISFILASTAAFAGFLPLLKAGMNGSGVAPVCSNKLDFSDSCNSQYITVI
jgi:hypothetical protein